MVRQNTNKKTAEKRGRPTGGRVTLGSRVASKVRFASTFPAGLQEVVRDTLVKKRGRFRILHLFDGLVIYETTYDERTLRDIRFFANTFLVHEVFENVRPTTEHLERLIGKVERNGLILHRLAKHLPPNRYTFSVVTSLESAMVPLPPENGYRLVETLTKRLPLRHRSKDAELEFWFILRSEGFGFFGTRITYSQRGMKAKTAGKLKAVLSHLMSLLSQPHPRDTVLDPFAGHGGIILERAGHFPYSDCVAVEADPDLVQTIKREAGRLHLTRFDAHVDDATILGTVPPYSITKIITDPPWGLYRQAPVGGIEAFYVKMLVAFARVLVGGGLAVVLSGAPEELDKALATERKLFTVTKRYPVLVSGKKAVLYKLRRMA